MKLTIIAIGKKHESYVREGVEDFTKRINRYTPVEWILLPHAGADEEASRRMESRAISEKFNNSSVIVLLDERGQMYDSPALARHLEQWQIGGRDVVFVIGGAYGVDDALQRRADYVWSLSQLVFPHQLVRLVLAEQLYRAFTILKGEPYHHK